MVLPSEPEFEQALNELTSTLQTFLKANPEYQKALDIVQIPERVIQFRVVWEDDKGQLQVRDFIPRSCFSVCLSPHFVQVNRGYRD